MSIYDGLRRSGGRMVQFSHPDLGGMGQWSSGMLMIGDFSNSELKERVRSMCAELADFTVETSEVDKVEPKDPMKRLEPMKRMEPMKHLEQMKPMEPMKPIEPMKQMKPMEPFKPFENIQWWPTSLGAPSSVGAQNQSRYAYFPETNRLAIEHDGAVTVFDTGKHKIHGASQAQGESNSLAFDSQLGRVTLSDFREVSTSLG